MTSPPEKTGDTLRPAPAPAGRVCLIGAGPGDVGLITVKGLARLVEADVVVYDALANPRLLDHVRADALLIDAGKRARHHKLTQDQINDLLIEHAAAGKRVARLKGGDPYIFGRGSEEAIALHARGIEVEVVPGIPAALAAPAYAGIPLTHRGVATSCTFITGHEDPTKDQSQVDYAALAGLARRGGTLCFYMGMGRLGEIAAELMRHDLPADTPAAVVQWGTLPTQRSVRATLDAIHDAARDQGLGAPAMIVVGPVAGLDAAALNWFEQRPLFGRTIVVTRSRPQASVLAQQLEALGASVIEAPTIRYAPVEDVAAFNRQLLEALPRADWLVLTSAQAVTVLRERLDAAGLDARALAKVKVAVVGQATAEATDRRLGIKPDLQPATQSGAALGEALLALGEADGARIVLLRSDIAGRDLPEQLTSAGAEVIDLVAYRTEPVDALPDALFEAIRCGAVDWVTFTSSSTVNHFVRLVGEARDQFQGVRCASIGPSTSGTCRGHGLQVAVEADPHDIPGLVGALCRVGGHGTSGRS